MRVSSLAWQRGFVGLMILVLAFLLGCGIYGAAAVGFQPRGADPAAAASSPPPTLEFSPRPGVTGVSPDQPVTLTADHARLMSVALPAADGTPVAGTAGADGRSWRASTPLRYSTTYTWTGQATGEGGTVPVAGSFSTVDPTTTTQAQINIDDGETVGIAAPV